MKVKSADQPARSSIRDQLVERIRLMIEEAPVLHRLIRAPGDISSSAQPRRTGTTARLFRGHCQAAGPASPVRVYRCSGFVAGMKFAVQPNDDLNLACLLAAAHRLGPGAIARPCLRSKGSRGANCVSAQRATFSSGLTTRRPSCSVLQILQRRRASSKPSSPDRCRAGQAYSRLKWHARRDR